LWRALRGARLQRTNVKTHTVFDRTEPNSVHSAALGGKTAIIANDLDNRMPNPNIRMPDRMTPAT